MGDFIPLFPQGDIRFTLSGDQRLRLRGLRQELRFKDGEDVVVAALKLFMQYFNMKRGGWILVAARGERTEDKLGERTIEIDCYPAYTPSVNPGLIKSFIRLLAIVLQGLTKDLLLIDRDESAFSREGLCHLEGKEYKIRCSMEWHQTIQEMQKIYEDAGWSAAIDDVVIRALFLLENLAKKHRREQRTFYFQSQDGYRANEILWEDFLDQFERTE